MPTLADLEALRAAQDSGGEMSPEAKAYRLKGMTGAPSGIEEFLGGAKNSWDRAALGLKRSLPQAVQDWGDKLGGGGAALPQTVAQGDKFVAETGPASTVGGISTDVGMALAPGMGAMRGAKLAKTLMGMKGLSGAGATLGLEAAGNAGWNALTAPEDKEKAAAIGAGGTVLGAGANRLLMGPLAPAVTKEGRKLLDANVGPTMGQMVSGPDAPLAAKILRRTEDSIQSIPFVGDPVKARSAQAMAGYNTALYNDIMRPLGIQVQKAGLAGFEEAKRALRDKYEEIVDKVHFPAEKAVTFMEDMKHSIAALKLDAEQTNKVGRFIDLHITPVIKDNAGGAIPGRVSRQIDKGLEQEAVKWRTKGGAWDANIADALDQLQKGWRDNIEGIASSADKEMFDKIATASSKLRPLEELTTKTNTGVFTPLKASKALSDAGLNEDALTKAAKQTLPDVVPDTGTGIRSALYHMLSPSGLSGAAGLAAYSGLPHLAPFLAAGAGLAALNTKSGTKYLAEGVEPIIKALRNKDLTAAGRKALEEKLKLIGTQTAMQYGNQVKDQIGD